MDWNQAHEIEASLRKAMREWVDKVQESRDPLPFWIGDRMADLMADAALTVLLSSDDAQTYLKREGYLKD